MSSQEDRPRGNWWLTGGMSFHARLLIGLAVLLVLALLWIASSADVPALAFVLLPMLAFVYLTPSLIAIGRRHKALGPIFALNLFLGWSLLGWVAALVWSLTEPKPAGAVVVEKSSGNMADELAKLAELKEKGVLTEEEFEARKKVLLS